MRGWRMTVELWKAVLAQCMPLRKSILTLLGHPWVPASQHNIKASYSDQLIPKKLHGNVMGFSSHGWRGPRGHTPARQTEQVQWEPRWVPNVPIPAT
eukprot:3413754-Pyramimonas_sp.AAC.1